MNISTYPVTVGRVIALLVLLACFVLALMGRLDYLSALLIGGVAFAELVP